MPRSLASDRDPFRGTKSSTNGTHGTQTHIFIALRIPQARILHALMPANISDPVSEWPLLDRPALAIRAGYTIISGSVTRALNGIREGSSSGDAHLGLLALGLVKKVSVDVVGLCEEYYKITHDGIKTYQHFIANGGHLPVVKDAVICTNDRYLQDKDDI